MPKFKVKTEFTFTGYFIVEAETDWDAKEFVEKHCGLVLGRGIHSSLPGDMVDWDFNMHPDKKIGAIRRA